MDIKEKLKSRRKELNLTMLDVANKVGVSEATVSRWESGDIANMRRDKIVLLANALQVSPSFIMGWETEEDSIASDLQTAFKIQELEKIRMQQEANTYTIHGSNGNGAVVITTDIPKDKYFLIGEGEASELTKSQYSALKGVLEAMSSSWEDK